MQHDNTTHDNADQALRSTIVAQLAAAGWIPIQGGTAIANRMFDTAVGLKEAQAYLADYGAASKTYILEGLYYSEGRNILGGSGILISKDADTVTVARLTEKFAAGAEKEILQSYAARLLRSRDIDSCESDPGEEEEGADLAPSM